MSILIKGGRVIDPDTGRDGICDVLIEEDRISKVEKDIQSPADQVIDAGGCFVMPGFIDLHVHLRDPGFEKKETIETGARAAARGGFTTILAMPNTNPVVDDGKGIRYVHKKAEKAAPVNVLQVGAVTKGQLGEKLADIEEMAGEGCPAISEDGKSVMNSRLYREAMKIAANCRIPVLAHCEDMNLAAGGIVNADPVTEKMGLKGISNAVEDIIAARDIMLSKETGARLHLCHCSTADSVEMVRLAKADGLDVTAEVCPHHFTLTTDDIKENDTNYKMNPPLRTRKDVDALIRGLKEDIMDVIATDHAPHTQEDKQASIQEAPFGIVGLETAAALVISELVDKEILTPMQMAEKMSRNPAKVIGIDKGSLAEGKTADVTVIDPEAVYTVNAGEFASKGRNTPFHGRTVKGKVIATVCGGKTVFLSHRTAII